MILFEYLIQNVNLIFLKVIFILGFLQSRFVLDLFTGISEFNHNTPPQNF